MGAGHEIVTREFPDRAPARSAFKKLVQRTRERFADDMSDVVVVAPDAGARDRARRRGQAQELSGADAPAIVWGLGLLAGLGQGGLHEF